MNEQIAKPQCPQCQVKGIEYIVSEDSVEQSGAGDAWFNVAFCSQCGYVYGVFAKVVKKPTFPGLSSG
jgi:hypothetical protein